MNDLNTHYRQLLGLSADWDVVEVDLDLSANRVTIDLQHAGGKLCCAECAQACSRADTAPNRTWRHLDTMQFTTEIRAAVPRTQCPQCGVKTIAVPWAGKHSHFTLMFEAFAIRVLQASANVSRAASLLGLSWDTAHDLMASAVQRGLERRETDNVKHVGIDEKSFGSGHSYVSVLTDTDQSRVLEVARDRTIAACEELWKTLTKPQLEQIESVSMDMWQAFMNSAAKHVPNAKIVHDKFHIAKYLGEAVDKVRRTEHRELKQEGESPLTGLRQLLLYNEENLDEDGRNEVLTIQRADLKTGRAWAIKENFRHFWTYMSRHGGKRFFTSCYAAMRSCGGRGSSRMLSASSGTDTWALSESNRILIGSSLGLGGAGQSIFCSHETCTASKQSLFPYFASDITCNQTAFQPLLLPQKSNIRRVIVHKLNMKVVDVLGYSKQVQTQSEWPVRCARG